MYTEDKDKALTILTTDVMAKLVEIKNGFYGNVEFVFFKDKVYFRIEVESAFDPTVFRSYLDRENIKAHYDLLCYIKESTQSIVDILKNASM